MDAMMIEGLGPPLCRVHMARGVIAMKANWKAVLNQFTADRETS
jgi:hypothetical protein